MRTASIFPAITPRRALTLQAGIIALAIGVAELAPRPGNATFYLPLAPAHRHPALDWALSHGGYVMGAGPAGGLLLGGAQPEFALHAAREGALAVAVPSLLCRQSES